MSCAYKDKHVDTAAMRKLLAPKLQEALQQAIDDGVPAIIIANHTAYPVQMITDLAKGVTPHTSKGKYKKEIRRRTAGDEVSLERRKELESQGYGYCYGRPKKDRPGHWTSAVLMVRKVYTRVAGICHACARVQDPRSQKTRVHAPKQRVIDCIHSALVSGYPVEMIAYSVDMGIDFVAAMARQIGIAHPHSDPTSVPSIDRPATPYAEIETDSLMGIGRCYGSGKDSGRPKHKAPVCLISQRNSYAGIVTGRCFECNRCIAARTTGKPRQTIRQPMIEAIMQAVKEGVSKEVIRYCCGVSDEQIDTIVASSPLI